ncbi:SDR family NAD(P)-dependent oxidoreductase [Rhodopila sp.]|uniref:SDR family NAD(P)-dependent oxidoreductase n=1 Tax=Rhodopila sp. TaxID=2480087 RepID=UPI003D09CB91
MPTVFITGGHKGLGLRSVQRIAASGGFDLVLGGRNLAEVEVSVGELPRDYNVNAWAVLLDVSSLASVRTAAAQFQAMVQDGKVAPLRVLMLNAGAQFLGDVSFSVDGYEQTFATNCLGNYLLICLLLGDIERGGRVVFTASGTHDPATMDSKMVGAAAAPDAIALANQGKHGKPISGGKRYVSSKLCTILYAYELDRRLRAADADIASIAFDPGLMVETGLIRSAPPVAQRILRTRLAKWLFRTLGVTMGSVAFSGDALADVAIDPRFATASGKYIQSRNGGLIEARSSKASYEAASASKLWQDSEALVDLQPEERRKMFPAIRAAAA